MKTTTHPIHFIGPHWIGARVVALAMSSTCADIAAAANSVSTSVPQPTPGKLEAAELSTFPLVPTAQRVDLVAAAFSNSTRVTNPLFPISNLRSVVLNGQVDGKVFRVETMLLPETQIIEWVPGQCVKVLVSQYAAYLNGRLEEVALDFSAQADDGSVWYFGEDVYNYADGVIADTGGTWRAGKEGPAAMIMPGNPKVGDAHRPALDPAKFRDLVTNPYFPPISGTTLTFIEKEGSETRENKFTVSHGTYQDCVKTKDWSLLKSGHEHKWFAKGVGFVRGASSSAETSELVAV